MVTKIINSGIFLVFLLILLFMTFGNKIIQLDKIYFQSLQYESELFSINLPENWILLQENNNSITFQGFPKENKYVSLHLVLWKQGTVFANKYENCENGYAIDFTENNSTILVCIKDLDTLKRPYFTYYFPNTGKYSISTRKYKPYYHQEYMQMISSIVLKQPKISIGQDAVSK